MPSQTEAVSPFTLHMDTEEGGVDGAERKGRLVSKDRSPFKENERYKKVNISIRKSVEFTAASPKVIQPFEENL